MKKIIMLLMMCLTLNFILVEPIYATEGSTNISERAVKETRSKGWSPSEGGNDEVEEINKNLAEFQDILKKINVGFTGVTILTAVLGLIYHFGRIALFSCSIDRYISMKEIATLIACLVLLGGIQIIINLLFMIVMS